MSVHKDSLPYLEEVEKLYLAGCSLKEIQRVLWEKYNFYRACSSIRRMLDYRNVKPRTRSQSLRGHRRLPYEEIKKIEVMYWDLKMSSNEIGDVLGLHYTAVTKRMHRAGIPTRSRSENTKLAYARGNKKPWRGGAKTKAQVEAERGVDATSEGERDQAHVNEQHASRSNMSEMS